MTRYFFDLRDGDTIVIDDEGREFRDREAARREASLAILNIARQVLLHCEQRVLCIEVRDEAGQQIGSTVLLFQASFDAPTRQGCNCL